MENSKKDQIPTMREIIDETYGKSSGETVTLRKGQSVGATVIVFDDVSRKFDLSKVSKLVISNKPDAL